MFNVLFTISNKNTGKTFNKFLPLFITNPGENASFDTLNRMYCERYYKSNNIIERCKFQDDHPEIFYQNQGLIEYLSEKKSCIEDVCIS